MMETYLFMALFLIYILTAFMVKKNVLNRIWSMAFIVCFGITAVAIAFIRVSGQDVMMSANQLNWYYLLYLFGSMSVVLGVINMWMYRKPMMRVFFNNSRSDEDDSDEDDEEEEPTPKKKGIF